MAKTFKILIADDESKNMAAMTDFLKSESDFEILEATDGQSAWALMEKQLPDLVITDFYMPQMDGVGLITKIRENEETQNIPVIFWSGVDNEELSFLLEALGNVEQLDKVVSKDQVVGTIRKLLH